MQNKTVRNFGLSTDDIFVCNSHSNTESLSLCNFKTKMSGDHFLRSFNVFKKKANQHYENVKTFQRYMPAVVQKIMRTFDSEQRSQFNILSVGSGTGEVDIEIVKIVQRELHKQREWRHISVFNRAIEPDDTSFQRYNEKIAKLVLGVSSSKYEVRKQKFEEYQESVKEPVSFDLIHFMHSLYYVNLQQTTVEPLLSGPPLSGHTLLNGQTSKSQEYLLYIIKDTTSIKRPPLFSGRGHLRAVPNSVFLLIITSFERSASFSKHNFHHN